MLTENPAAAIEKKVSDFWVTTGDLSSSTPVEKAASPRALGIPEVLDVVLGYSSNGTLAVCTRVCSSWSSPSLDRLWRDMESIVPILELISPLRLVEKEDGSQQWEFSRGLSQVDWDHFRTYATRVRTLTFSGSAAIHGTNRAQISHSAIASATLAHRFGNTFLPRLETLDWKLSKGGEALSILPFVPIGLKDLRLRISAGVQAKTARRMLFSLVKRAPELTDFTLTTPLPARSLYSALHQWIPTAPLLKHVTLPRLFLTPDCVESLARLVDLKCLDIDWNYTQKFDAYEDGAAFKLDEGTFASLRKLAFESLIPQAANLFNPSCWFVQLIELTISCFRFDDCAALECLLTNIARSCPDLTSLFLNLASDRTILTSPISFAVIKRLFPCKNINSFYINHDWPIELSKSDIEEMGHAWTNLGELYLCSDPYEVSALPDSGVPVTLLRVFAASLPCLVKLGLYLRGDIGPCFDGDLDPIVQFGHVVEFDVGLSYVPGGEAGPVAFVLASLFPRETKVVHGRSYWTLATADEEDNRDTSAWIEVDKLFKLAWRTKEVFKDKASSSK